MAQGETPLMTESPAAPTPGRSGKREPLRDGAGEAAEALKSSGQQTERSRRPRRGPEPGMQTYRLEVGHQHGVKPANIVGAIANEAQMESRHIGLIEIFADYSLVDLPEGMPKEIYRELQKVWVAGQQLRISKIERRAGAKNSDKVKRLHAEDRSSPIKRG
jgi:ATP-dependent RNA helicase DeaD